MVFKECNARTQREAIVVGHAHLEWQGTEVAVDALPWYGSAPTTRAFPEYNAWTRLGAPYAGHVRQATQATVPSAWTSTRLVMLLTSLPPLSLTPFFCFPADTQAYRCLSICMYIYTHIYRSESRWRSVFGILVSVPTDFPLVVIVTN